MTNYAELQKLVTPKHVDALSRLLDRLHAPELERYMPIRAVEAAVCYKKSSIYSLMAKGEFPKPINLGPNKVCWRERDIAAWLNARIGRGS